MLLPGGDESFWQCGLGLEGVVDASKLARGWGVHSCFGVRWEHLLGDFKGGGRR